MSWSEAVSLVARLIAVPYGYTLAVWSAGILAVGRYGQPRVREVLLFVSGAILGYLSFDVLTLGARTIEASDLSALPPLALLNILPLIPPLAVSLLARRLQNRGLGFFVVGLGATVVYIASVVLLVVLVA